MDFNDPIKISPIKDYVTLKNGIKLKDALRSLDSFADGGRSDGQFTRANFRRLQKMGRFYLKAKNLFAYDTKMRFSNFAQFHQFVARFILSQRCKDPKNWHEKEIVANDVVVKKRVCESFPEPAVPPKRRFRRRTRQKRRTTQPRKDISPKPDRSDDNDDILSMRHGPRKQVEALKPSRNPNTKMPDDSLRRLITMPRRGLARGTMICKNTPSGPKCTVGGKPIAMKTLCAKYKDRLPVHVAERCPERKPDLANIMRGMCLAGNGCTPCITKSNLSALQRKNPAAYRYFMKNMRPHMVVSKDCLPRCNGSAPFRPKRINSDGTVTFHKPRVTHDPNSSRFRIWERDYRVFDKLRYLDRTRAKRLAIRKQWKRKIERGYFKSLNARLLKLWRRKDMSYAAKRWTLFELWNECLENGTTERARKAQFARSMIIAFIKKQLPKGSPHAFTTAELARIAKLRAGASPFKPYSS